MSKILSESDADSASNDIRTQRAKRVNSTKLEIGRSPQDYLNKFILDKVQGFNLEQL